MDIAAFIKDIRIKNNLTQTEFADRLSISRSALTQLEAGNSKPSFEVLRILAESFDVDVARFFPRKKSGKRVQVDATATAVKRITDFYSKHYQIQYNELMEDRLIEIFSKTETSDKNVIALQSVYRNYRAASRITDKLQRDFIDPLKRHITTMKLLRQMEAQEMTPELRKETDEIEAALTANLKIIFRDAFLFDFIYGDSLAQLSDLLEHERVEPVRQDSEHHKIMKYSEERYLNAFVYLLRNAHKLEEAEEYFELESYWRE